MSMGLSAFHQLMDIRKARGLPVNPAELPKWSFELFGLMLTLPNFSWRRDAIDKHDLHHLILDEPFTMAGECQVATWEFAAGAFPDKRAQLFCLPLVTVGAMTAPGRTWRSFEQGCRETSLYRINLSEMVNLSEITKITKIPHAKRTDQAFLRFVKLLFISVLVYALPIAFILVAAMIW